MSYARAKSPPESAPDRAFSRIMRHSVAPINFPIRRKCATALAGAAGAEPRAKSQEPRAKSQEPRDYLVFSDFVNPLIVYFAKFNIFSLVSHAFLKPRRGAIKIRLLVSIPVAILSGSLLTALVVRQRRIGYGVG
jgi:hypothetical protein